MKLKNRQQCPPNGFMFVCKATGWKSWLVDPTSQWDFNLLVKRVHEHFVANPGLGLPTDVKQITEMVDTQNALRVATIPNADMYITRTNDPKSQAHSSQGPAVVVGGKVLIEWIRSGEEAVPADLANQRALICIGCPQHGKGDWTRYFTEPAAAAIKAEYERRKEMKLSTPYDDKLAICDACSCPLKLKVHIPIDRARSGLKDEQRSRLDPRCWLLNE